MRDIPLRVRVNIFCEISFSLSYYVRCGVRVIGSLAGDAGSVRGRRPRPPRSGYVSNKALSLSLSPRASYQAPRPGQNGVFFFVLCNLHWFNTLRPYSHASCTLPRSANPTALRCYLGHQRVRCRKRGVRRCAIR
jgi:hypothetical protein